jgi:putative endonuclease
VEQLVARWAHNPKVVGSSPAPATKESHCYSVAFLLIAMLMYWTYIIYSDKYDKYYIGFTHDLIGRLAAHNHLKNKGYTKKFRPWRIVYSKMFNTKKSAMEHEKHLKSLKSKNAIQELLASN